MKELEPVGATTPAPVPVVKLWTTHSGALRWAVHVPLDAKREDVLAVVDVALDAHARLLEARRVKAVAAA